MRELVRVYRWDRNFFFLDSPVQNPVEKLL